MYEYSPDTYFITLTPDSYYGEATTRPREIKELFIVFGDDIQSEPEAGRGETVDAVLALLYVPAPDKSDAIHALRQLAVRNYNDLEFTQGIIDSYMVKSMWCDNGFDALAKGLTGLL